MNLDYIKLGYLVTDTEQDKNNKQDIIPNAFNAADGLKQWEESTLHKSLKIIVICSYITVHLFTKALVTSSELSTTTGSLKASRYHITLIFYSIFNISLSMLCFLF